MIGRTQADVEEGLTHVDGGCRDANWFGLNVDGVVAIFEYLVERYTERTINIYEGDEVFQGNSQEAVKALRQRKTVQAYLDGGPKELSQIQFYGYHDEKEPSWFVELTFFPQDVALENGLGAVLQHFETMREASGASGWLIRVENASFDADWSKRNDQQVIVTSEEATDLIAGH